MKLPERKKLPHEVPSWVETGNPFFITICTVPKGTNQLCLSEVSESILKSVEIYQDKHIWYCHLFLLMPDHVHAIISFPQDRVVKGVISKWKAYQARFNRVKWQDDFFDHRFRNVESLDEKTHYILMNPVRKGLVTKMFDWEYVWRP